MKPGPKPVPTELKIIHGNPGKRPLNESEPKPDVELPSCPPHLDECAVDEWNRIAKELLKIGLLTNVDRSALAAYCQVYSRWVSAEEGLKETSPILIGDKGGHYQNPLLHVANKALDQMKSFLVEFGMTPSSRTRLSVPKSAKDSSAVAKFAQRKNG